MQLNFTVVLAVGSLCVSLVSCWYSVRTHRRLHTIKKFEAARDEKNTRSRSVKSKPSLPPAGRPRAGSVRKRWQG
jgi:hypothetical protein